MEKKKWVKLAGFAMVFLLSLFLCVGCNGNTDEDNPVSVSFVSAFEDSSRGGLSQEYVSKYVPEGLYWTFTAVKTSGAHSTGASEKDKDGNLIEQPVRGDRGFSGSLHEFSKGGWSFTLYGYIDKNHTQLVYKLVKNVNVTATTSVVFDTLTSATAAEGGVMGTKGILEIGELTVRVPDTFSLVTIDSVIKVEIFSGTEVIAVSETVLENTNIASKKTFMVNSPVFAAGKNMIDAGLKTLRAKVTCKHFPVAGSDTYHELVIGVFPIVCIFKAGVVTKVSGTLGDLAVKPLGGKIFYVDSSTGAGKGAVYTFYDASGNVLTGTTVSALATAVAYSVEGIAEKDKYYVYNKDMIASGYRFWANDTSVIGTITNGKGGSPVAYVDRYGSSGRVFYNHHVNAPGTSAGSARYPEGSNPEVVGYGRGNTEYFLNLNLFYPSGTTSKAIGCDSKYYAEDPRTVWYFLKNKVNAGRTDFNKTGLYDWYIPSLGELYELRVYDSTTFPTGKIWQSSTVGTLTSVTSSEAGSGCAAFWNTQYQIYWKSLNDSYASRYTAGQGGFPLIRSF